jgi:hypothetical protein
VTDIGVWCSACSHRLSGPAARVQNQHHHHHQANVGAGPSVDLFSFTRLEVTLMISPVSSAFWLVVFLLSSVIYHNAFCLHVANSSFVFLRFVQHWGNIEFF